MSITGALLIPFFFPTIERKTRCGSPEYYVFDLKYIHFSFLRLSFITDNGFEHEKIKQFTLFYRKQQASLFIPFEQLNFHQAINHSTIEAFSCKR